MIEYMYRAGKFVILLTLSVAMGLSALFLVYLVYCTGHTLIWDDAVTYTFRIHQIRGQAIAAIFVFFSAVCLAFMVDHSYNVKS